MRSLQTFLIPLIAALMLALPTFAQSDGTPVTAPDPALLETLDQKQLELVRAGDPYAALTLGFALLDPWQERNLVTALPFFTTAYSKAGDDLYLMAYAAMMIGRVRNGLSDYTDGIVFAEHAEDIARSLTDDNRAPALVVAAMQDHVAALQGLERYQETLPILESLLLYHQSLDPKDGGGEALAFFMLGWSYESMDDFTNALHVYSQAWDHYVELEGPEGDMVSRLANNIGWVNHRLGKYDDAEKWFSYALPVFEKNLGRYARETGQNYINLGITNFELGRPDDAIRWIMKSMPFIADNRKLTLSDQRWAFETLARAFAAKQQPGRAIFFGKMAVNAQQDLRATNTRGTKGDTEALQTQWLRLYQLLADLLITQGRISEAQAVLAMQKEEEVFNFLQRDAEADLTKTRATLNDAELDEEAKLTTLAALPIAADRELRALMVKSESGKITEDEEDQMFLLEDALQVASDRFDAAVTAFLDASDDDTKAVLTPQFAALGSLQVKLEEMTRPTAVLQTAALPDALHLFVTLPGLALHEKVDISRADLARLVFDTLQSVETVAPDAPEKLQALHKVLFAPIQQALIDSGTEVVMLNLDGFLRYVPFAALHDDSGYLIERFGFALYTPAVSNDFRAPDRTNRKTAGFGVTKGHPGFSPLPGVRRELETIFGAGAGQGVLSGATALDAAFDERSLRSTLREEPAILHIASHFNLMPGQEDDSFLLLGDGERLPLAKIRKVKALSFRGIDLLTLSACQTARGSDGDGAEIDGFGATAQLNGAAAVMASLWPVSDAATPKLMRDFYEGLMVKGLDKAEALRQAQLAMLFTGGGAGVLAADRAAVALDTPEKAPKAGFDHPYFWSAFVLMGNWL